MKINIGDIDLWFDVEGSSLVPDGPVMRERPTVVMLHGGPGFDHSHLKPFYSRLAEFAQVVFVDQRGTGRSDPSTPEKWNLDQWADDVDAVCRTLGIEKPIVTGVSAGGFVAMAYAIRHPDGPGKVIVSGTGANMRPDRMLPVFERLGGAEARAVAEAFWTKADDEARLTAYLETCFPLYYQTPQDPDWMARSIVNAEMLSHFFKPGGEGMHFDLLPGLANVKCPMMVLTGEHDPVLPAEGAAEIAAALPDGLARYEYFPNCGHTPERDDPDAVLAMMREFILDT